MKTKFLKFSPVILLFAFLIAACQKDDVFEIKIGDVNPVIVQEVNGIEFTFCLLNEQGEPATVFNEGENFTFQFVIKNKTGESLTFFDYSFYEDADFFSVYNRNQNFGRPFEIIPGFLSNEMRYIFNNMSSSFISPWQDNRSRFDAMYGSFKGLNKMTLDNGTYVTSFTHNFHLGDIYTGKLIFKINFEIK